MNSPLRDMSYDALRIGRASIPGQAYFVTTVTAGRLPWFADFALARMVVAEMRRLAQDGWVDSVAWVLMPDHLHWLFQLGERVTLSEVVKAFKGRTARVINEAQGRDGVLWQKSFHDHALRAEDDLPATARYIVANPLWAGLVSCIGDYPHWDAIWL